MASYVQVLQPMRPSHRIIRPGVLQPVHPGHGILGLVPPPPNPPTISYVQVLQPMRSWHHTSWCYSSCAPAMASYVQLLSTAHALLPRGIIRPAATAHVLLPRGIIRSGATAHALLPRGQALQGKVSVRAGAGQTTVDAVGRASPWVSPRWSNTG